jgi:hypothetical protein
MAKQCIIISPPLVRRVRGWYTLMCVCVCGMWLVITGSVSGVLCYLSQRISVTLCEILFYIGIIGIATGMLCWSMSVLPLLYIQHYTLRHIPYTFLTGPTIESTELLQIVCLMSANFLVCMGVILVA